MNSRSKAAPKPARQRPASTRPRAPLPSARAALAEKGAELPAADREQFEDALDADLSGVRLHTGLVAERAAGVVGARAFTFGDNIVFGRGGYEPSSAFGRSVLAHELAHVVQQRGSGASGSAHEREAQAFGSRGGSEEAYPIEHRSAPAIARLPESIDKTLDVRSMSDDEIRAELREIIQWIAGQIETGDLMLSLEESKSELEAELARRRRETARSAAKARKPKKAKGKEAAAATPAAPAPRSASTSFNPEDLTPEEQAEELQLTEEWLASKPKKAWNRKYVEESRGAVSGSLAARESAPLMENHYFVIGRVRHNKLELQKTGPLNRYQAIAELERHLKNVGLQTESAIAGIDLIYKQRNEHRIISPIAEAFSWADDPEDLLEEWSKSRDLQREAEKALYSHDFVTAASLGNQAITKSLKILKGVRTYFGDVEKGAGRAVTGLEVVKAGAAVTLTIGTGGWAGVAVGGGYAGAQNLAQQTSEIAFGLRDRIDWGGLAFDTAFGALTSYMGGALGNKILAKLLKNPATASLGKKALSYVVSDYVSGRAGSTLQVTGRMIFDKLRGKNVTWDQYLDAIADQFTDPKQAVMDVLMGHAGRKFATHVDTVKAQAKPPKTADGPAPAPLPEAAPVTAEPAAVPAAQAPSESSLLPLAAPEPAAPSPQTPPKAPQPPTGSATRRASTKITKALMKGLEQGVPAVRSGFGGTPVPMMDPPAIVAPSKAPAHAEPTGDTSTAPAPESPGRPQHVESAPAAEPSPVTRADPDTSTGRVGADAEAPAARQQERTPSPEADNRTPGVDDLNADTAFSETAAYQTGRPRWSSRRRRGNRPSLDTITLTAAQRVNALKLQGQRFSKALRRAWRRTSNAREQAEMQQVENLWNSGQRDAARQLARETYNRHRDRFWGEVRRNPRLRAIFTDAGMVFPAGDGAPHYVDPVTGARIDAMTLEHSTRLHDDPARATDPFNFQTVLGDENSVMLEAIRRWGNW